MSKKKMVFRAYQVNYDKTLTPHMIEDESGDKLYYNQETVITEDHCEYDDIEKHFKDRYNNTQSINDNLDIITVQSEGDGNVTLIFFLEKKTKVYNKRKKEKKNE